MTWMGEPVCPLCGGSVIEGDEPFRRGSEFYTCASAGCDYWRREPPLGLPDEKKMGPPVLRARRAPRRRRVA